MFAKLNNNQVEQYPYSFDQLRKDNPNTSFPLDIDDASLTEYNLVRVYSTQKPNAEYHQKVVELTPVQQGDTWVQAWGVVERSQEEITTIGDSLRSSAYRNESDPLFFKVQRGEATHEEWLIKVEQIKARYPY